MKAWVSRETVVDGKRKYEKFPPGTKGFDIGRNDRWIVFYMVGKKLRRERIDSRGKPGKIHADDRAASLISDLESGAFERKQKESWEKTRREYERWSQIKSAATQKSIRDGLNDFERIVRPKTLADVTVQAIEHFISTRLNEHSQRRIVGRTESGEPIFAKISPASANATLRVVRVMMNKAKRWGYIQDVPHFELVREPGRLVVFVNDDDFGKLYQAAESTKLPSGIANVPPSQWWRSLMTFLAVTGWRIGSALALRWEDVDL